MNQVRALHHKISTVKKKETIQYAVIHILTDYFNVKFCANVSKIKTVPLLALFWLISQIYYYTKKDEI